ncbi:MAG: 2-dehydropantoate 2-reductase [Acetobacterales bacterium]
MKYCIYGAGAIGGHVAARLAKAGEEVSAIARGPHLEAIRQDGLTLLVADQDRFTVDVNATDKPAELGPQDVIFVAVKGPALPAVAEGIRPLMKDDTAVVFAMNGVPWWFFHGLPGKYEGRRIETVDPGGRMWDAVGPGRAIGCVVNSANHVVAPGVVRNDAPKPNRFWLGEPDGSRSERVLAISAAMEKGGFAAPVSEDIRKDIWGKGLRALANASIGSLTTTASCHFLSNPDIRPIARAMMQEGYDVGVAVGCDCGIDIDADIDQVAGSPPHRHSMLQDLEAGRPMEIDGIIGVVQEMSRMTGTPTPTIDMVLALVKQRARSAGLYDG